MVKSDGSARYRVRVRGVVLPTPISGNPALELCNTWAGWTDAGEQLGTPDRHDYLKTWSHLTALALDRGLLAPEWEARLEPAPGATDKVMTEARGLRAAAYRSVTRTFDAADLDRVSRLAAEARTHQRLVRNDDGVSWELQPSAGLRAPLLAAAVAVVDLLTTTVVDRVRACPGHDCGWLFLDISGRRRWCQMAVCGNRAKVRAFVERQS